MAMSGTRPLFSPTTNCPRCGALHEPGATTCDRCKMRLARGGLAPLSAAADADAAGPDTAANDSTHGRDSSLHGAVPELHDVAVLPEWAEHVARSRAAGAPPAQRAQSAAVAPGESAVAPPVVAPAARPRDRYGAVRLAAAFMAGGAVAAAALWFWLGGTPDRRAGEDARSAASAEAPKRDAARSDVAVPQAPPVGNAPAAPAPTDPVPLRSDCLPALLALGLCTSTDPGASR
jgi:hypothetical protein